MGVAARPYVRAATVLAATDCHPAADMFMGLATYTGGCVTCKLTMADAATDHRIIPNSCLTKWQHVQGASSADVHVQIHEQAHPPF